MKLLGFAAFFALCTLAPRIYAQSPCDIPNPEVSVGNLFSLDQENILGDIMEEHTSGSQRRINNDELTRPLRNIVDRLLKVLPFPPPVLRVYLSDLPTANAFASVGGRIVITRRLVASVKKEDELAGILAHEIGHLVSRHHSLRISKAFRTLIATNQVGDSTDILEKYHQYVEASIRRPLRSGSVEEEQGEADKIGVWAMAKAGYDPDSITDFFGRFAEAEPDSGNFLSNLFNTVKPDNKRLAEMVKVAKELPASCKAARPASAAADFLKWQAAVIAHKGLNLAESLHGVKTRKSLDQPLRGNLSQLRFSPNGRHLLAQDASGISVLSTDPMALLFRIDSNNALPAQFTPDSLQIVVHNSSLRVEIWNLNGEQLSVRELGTTASGCTQSGLSPDGNYLVCWQPLRLRIFEVETRATVWDKAFPRPAQIPTQIRATLLGRAQIAFSPDARYAFIRPVNGPYGSATIAFDLQTRTEFPLSKDAKELLTGGLVFLGPKKLFGVNSVDPKKSGVLSIPDGKIIERFSFPLTARLSGVTSPDYVLIGPIKEFSWGVVNLKTQEIFKTSRTDAIDIHGDTLASERLDGEPALYGLNGTTPRARVELPPKSLGALRSAASSQDLQYVALSEVSRGGIWNASTGQRVFYTRGFSGAHFDSDGSMYADLPALNETTRRIVKVTEAGTQAGEVSSLPTPLENIPNAETVRKFGSTLIVTKALNPNSQERPGLSIESRDAATQRVLWSAAWKDAPRPLLSNGDILYVSWTPSSEMAQDEISKSQSLKNQLSSAKEKESMGYVRIIDARSGQTLGAILLEFYRTLFGPSQIFLAGNRLLAYDVLNRTTIYDLTTGKTIARVFGRIAGSPGNNRFAIQNHEGHIELYRLDNGAKFDDLRFPSAVVLLSWSQDSKTMLALTADQTAYTFDAAQFQP